ncbi:MAG: hypothetical protein CBC50_03535 [Synechococcus sp. TMED90]|nr:MAG: hypothetical protein CBC50_03535 [Synechococcus sp. TMED90]|tara:strand:+ start:84 stop:461 length:378 start_codon:yes stop_codon:yes gene_type:complete
MESSSPTGPLTRRDAERIEATLLPTLDRHHLRLQAHCLATLKSIAAPRCHGPLPSDEEIQAWCGQQPALRDDSDFQDELLRQFQVISDQLNTLADVCGCTPLELTLDALINDAEAASRRRLAQGG